MTSAPLRDRLRHELTARGCTPEGLTPHGTMIISDEHLEDILDLLDIMIRRREKAFGSVAVVGHESAKATYDDAVLVVDAIKSILAPLCETV